MNLTKTISSNIRRLCNSRSSSSAGWINLKTKNHQCENDKNNYPGQPSHDSHGHKFNPDDVTLGVGKSEFRERREKLMNVLRRNCAEKSGFSKSAEHCAIFPAATIAYSAPDVPYQFRQESNFLYLSGYQEPDSFLVLRNDGGEICRSTLYVQPKDKDKELWHGPIPGVDGAVALTGVDEAFHVQDLKSSFEEILSKSDYVWYDPFCCVGVNRDETARTLLKISEDKGLTCLSPYKYIHQLRWLKSPAEIRLLRKAGEIGSKGLTETMKYSYPGVEESCLVAKMDLECRQLGAERLAYPPVVAGGDRANIIHYLNADQLVHENELILMDAGCEYGGYVSDITRCWPVAKKFTDPQRVLYEILLEVQTECLKLVESRRPLTLRDLYFRMLHLLADGLRSAGTLKSSSAMNERELLRLVDALCPHHVSHYLGMDVHDTETVPKNIPLQPNVVITVEPGLYFTSRDVHVHEEYRGIGLRLEDDVLITETGSEVLSASCPKTIDDLKRTVFSSK